MRCPVRVLREVLYQGLHVTTGACLVLLEPGVLMYVLLWKHLNLFLLHSNVAAQCECEVYICHFICDVLIEGNITYWGKTKLFHIMPMYSFSEHERSTYNVPTLLYVLEILQRLTHNQKQSKAKQQQETLSRDLKF